MENNYTNNYNKNYKKDYKNKAKKKFKQIIRQRKTVFMVFIVVFGLVFCSVLFNISYPLYQKGIAALEKTLKGTLAWSDAHIGPNGTINLRNVYIYENNSDVAIDTEGNSGSAIHEKKDKMVVLYGENVQLDMGLVLMMKYLFLPFDKITEYDKSRLIELSGKEEKTLSYVFLKSLQKVEIDTIRANITFPKDNYLLDLLEVALFSKKMLPYDGYLNLNHIYANIITPMVNIQTNDFDLDFNLSDFKGISAIYGGAVELGKIKQEVVFDIAGNFLTKDFFNNVEMTTAINSTSYNALGITPLEIELYKTFGDVVFNVEWVDTDINIIGAIKDNVLDVDISLKEAKVEDIFIFDINNEIESFSKDILSGQGRITGNIKEKKLQYSMQMKNNDNSKNTISVDISGDEDYINFSDIVVQLTNQYFIADGGMSLLNFGINGRVSLSLDKPLLNDKIKGDFYFTNTPFSSIGRSSSFYINDVEQDNITVEYSKIERFFRINTAGISKPIIDIYADEFDTYDIRIQQFPMSIVASVYNANDITYLNNSYVNAHINFKYQYARISDATYSIEAFNTLQRTDTISMKGRYNERRIFIDESTFSFLNVLAEGEKIQGSMNGNFYTSFYDEEKTPVTMRVIIEEQGLKKQYDILAKYMRKNVYRLSANKDFIVDISFDNNAALNRIDTLSHINVNANNFYMPFIQSRIYSHSSISLDNTAITNAKIDISIQQEPAQSPSSTDTDMVSFVLKANYNQGEGIIHTLSFANNNNRFEGIGNFSLSDTLINMSIIELPSIEDAQVQQTTIQGQSLSIEYGLVTKSLNIASRNIQLGLFTDKINGIINGDFLIDRERKNILGSISESTIRLETDTYTISSDFYLEGFSNDANMTINNLHIVKEDMIVQFPKIQIKNFNHIEGNFSLAQENTITGDIKALYEGEGLIDAEQSFITAFESNPNNILEHMGDFSGNIRLAPMMLDTAEMMERYSYNIDIKSTDDITFIRDKRRNILIRLDNKERLITGNIGGVNNLVFLTLGGSYKPSDMKLDIGIRHINVGVLNTELFHNMDIIEIEQMMIKGSVGIQGNILDPSVYGAIQIEELDGFFPFFNTQVSVDNMSILISDKDISIVNTHFKVDKNIIFMSAQGKLAGGVLDYLDIIVSTKKDNPFPAKRFRFAGIEVTGDIAARVDVFVQDNIVDIKGRGIITNATISNELFSARQQIAIARGKTRKKTLTINAEVYATVNNGVIFVWPSNTFPVLKAGFSDNQEIIVGFDGELREFSIHSNLFFDSGTIYYFDKPFDIHTLEVRMDEFNTADDPYIVSLDASSRIRYDDRNYLLELTTQSTVLSNMQVHLSATPYLSNNEISAIFGQSITPDTALQNTDSSTSIGLVSSLIKISDPVSNIGIFSRIENALQRSLKVDSVSFRSKMVQNLLDFSISSNRNTTESADNTSFYSYNTDVFLPYLLDKSSFAIGKYIDIVYLNFGVELDTAVAIQTSRATYNNDSLFIPIKTALNVEIPTPLVDFTWTGTVEPHTYDNRSNYIPMNFLTISWQKKF